MIDEVEFERRIAHWFSLVMKALEKNIERAINESYQLSPSELGDPYYLADIEEADIYRHQYLPEAVLAFHLDHLMPPGFLEKSSRTDFLLQRGLVQHHAQRIAAHTIDKAKRECL